MEIRPIRLEEHEAARALLAANGWASRVVDPALFAHLLSHSQLALVAVEGGGRIEARVIGFLRALTDGIFNGYISMLVVDAAWRGRGVGRALVPAGHGRSPGDEPGCCAPAARAWPASTRRSASAAPRWRWSGGQRG